jgi:hypothetical protein
MFISKAIQLQQRWVVDAGDAGNDTTLLRHDPLHPAPRVLRPFPLAD